MMLEDEIVMNKNTGGAAVEDTARDQAPENVQDGQSGEPEKKYTDADVDRIIARKIAAERRKLTREIDGQRESDLDAREKNILKRELQADVKANLAAAGLPVTLADLLNYESKEACDQSYDTLIAAFREAMQGQMNVRMRGAVVPRDVRLSAGTDPVAAAFRRKD